MPSNENFPLIEVNYEQGVMIWGIGRHNAKKLQSVGAFKALDFVNLPESWVLKNMTITGLNLQKDLQGIPSIAMVDLEKKKSISNTRTFEADLQTYDELRERITTFTSMGAEKLRQQESMCKKIVVFLETNRFREHDTQYSPSVQMKLPFPTNSTLELVKFANVVLKHIYRGNVNYKRGGVLLTDFIDSNAYQPSLFFNSNPKHKRLMEVMDNLKAKYHKDVLRVASQDARKHKMKQEHLSRHYTTDINDILVVKI